jgi:hypothetical protein
MIPPEEAALFRDVEEQMAQYRIDKRLALVARPTVAVGNIISRVLGGNDWDPDFDTRVEVGKTSLAVGIVGAAALSTILLGIQPGRYY